MFFYAKLRSFQRRILCDRHASTLARSLNGQNPLFFVEQSDKSFRNQRFMLIRVNTCALTESLCFMTCVISICELD